MEVTPERVELITKVQEKITKFPGSYDQETYAESVQTTQAPCGTACCIAGWTLLLSDNYVTVPAAVPKFPGELLFVEKATGELVDAGDTAQAILGLTTDEANVLFNSEPSYNWPAGFADEWEDAETNAERARIACEYLEEVKIGNLMV